MQVSEVMRETGWRVLECNLGDEWDALYGVLKVKSQIIGVRERTTAAN